MARWAICRDGFEPVRGKTNTGAQRSFVARHGCAIAHSMETTLQVMLALVAAAAVSWAALVVTLAIARPRGPLLREALRLFPDALRLLRALAADRALPRGVRVRLWALFAYLAMPFDLIPDFVPVLGYADDAILIALVLRSVVRLAGADAIRRHWRGTADGLAALWRVAGLPGTPEGDSSQ